MYTQLSDEEKNQQARDYCRVTGNTPIKGKKTTDSKVTNGGTYNQLVNTGIESKGFKYESRSFTRKGTTYSKTFKIAVKPS